MWRRGTINKKEKEGKGLARKCTEIGKTKRKKRKSLRKMNNSCKYANADGFARDGNHNK